jgi:hypothetical protein
LWLVWFFLAPESSPSTSRGIIQSIKFSKAKSTRIPVSSSYRTHHDSTSTCINIRDPIASYWPELHVGTLLGADPGCCLLRQYTTELKQHTDHNSIRARRKTICVKASFYLPTPECWCVLSEQHPHRRGTVAASLTYQQARTWMS